MTAQMATPSVAGHSGTLSPAPTLDSGSGAITATTFADHPAEGGASYTTTSAGRGDNPAAGDGVASAPLGTVRSTGPRNVAARTLHEVPVRRSGILVDIVDESIGAAVKYRLTELGLRIGEELTIVQKTSGNGRLVAVGTVHYAMDKRTCRAIMVEGDF